MERMQGRGFVGEHSFWRIFRVALESVHFSWDFGIR